jgi:menaquinone-dependent protoporphyrinogen oxidase
MRVLVASATRHGATGEIAEAIASTLTARGVNAELRRVEDVEDLGGYDAVVLGSAVYIGKWLEPARQLAEDHAAELATRPTWLFSSGPLGEPARPDAAHAVQVDDLIERTHAREHRLFDGRLDPYKVSFLERTVAKAVRAKAGDFRNWDAIHAWANSIADALADVPVAGG